MPPIPPPLGPPRPVLKAMGNALYKHIAAVINRPKICRKLKAGNQT